jgi:DNA-binding Lrp family transcriptional regulator
VLLSQQVARVVEFVNGLSYVPTLSEISSAVGLSPSSVWRILRGLREAGVTFRAVTDLSKLGLIEVVLVYRTRIPKEKIPWKMLRSFIRTLERVTFLRYVSRIHEVELVVNYVVNHIGEEPSEVYVIDHVIPPRYVMSHLTRSSLDRLYVRELLALTVAPPLPTKPGTAGRVDSVDISIINSLEEDVFTKMKDIHEAVSSRMKPPPSYQTVLRHYREHILGRGVITGVRPTLENFVERMTSSSKKLLVLEGPPSLLIKAVRAITGIPSFAEAYISTREGYAIVSSSLPLNLIPKVVDFIGLLESRGLIKEWTILEIEPVSTLNMPIPESLGEASVSELLEETKS